MNTQSIFTIALKFLGIQLGISAIEKFTRVVLVLTKDFPNKITFEYTLGELSSPLIGPMQIFLFIFYSVSCWYLFTHAGQLSKKWIREQKETFLGRDRLIELVILFQGIGLLVYGIPSLIVRVVQQSLISENVFALTNSLASQFSSVMYMIEILLGIFFIFRAQRISKWLTKVIPEKFWQ